MAFSWQTIKYGWLALAGVTITGVTIFVVNNTRQQVQQIDVSELVLGVYERCLATQYATNPVTYYVGPPSFVRDWIEGTSVVAQATSVVNGVTNVSTVTNFAVVTNAVTNAFGWQVDRSMLIELDATIKALVPYYVDTNTVYDGTTNIVMLTVTGLWASLGIGDGTNQFTSVPCWTNPVQTNWIVNYTSYWPSTNGTATNICYTSDYRQVVNYAQSWTVTGGHVWVTSSNWASEVVTITNAATYGDYPWQIYVEDLQERYKVLNALKMTYPQKVICNANYARTYGLQGYQHDWNIAKTVAESNYFASGVSTSATFRLNQPDELLIWSADFRDVTAMFGTCGINAPGGLVVNATAFEITPYINLNTSVLHKVAFWYICNENQVNSFWVPSVWFEVPITFDGYGEFLQGNWHILRQIDWTYNGYCSVSNSVLLDPSTNFPTWCDEPVNTWDQTARGFYCDDSASLVDWQFNYCTNKYW